jgi:hypothetical protein
MCSISLFGYLFSYTYDSHLSAGLPYPAQFYYVEVADFSASIGVGGRLLPTLTLQAPSVTIALQIIHTPLLVPARHFISPWTAYRISQLMKLPYYITLALANDAYQIQELTEIAHVVPRPHLSDAVIEFSPPDNIHLSTAASVSTTTMLYPDLNNLDPDF